MKNQKTDFQQSTLFPENRNNIKSIPSLIKWTGSKRSQASEILKLIPNHTRYFEPFLGGGAMLYALAQPNSVANDIFKPLVDLWKIIQCNPMQVIKDYKEKWGKLNHELNFNNINCLPKKKNTPEFYYQVRDNFNETKNALDLNFIMRTCVNGIVRFNEKGEFNNSFHLSRRGMDPDTFAKSVLAWNKKIQGVSFFCQDYSDIIVEAKATDFIYFDPPYAANKQRYISNLNLDKFFSELDILNSKNVKWGLSFDGTRGDINLIHDIPKQLYKRHILLKSGKSAVNKVLNGPVENVYESFYVNY